MPVTETDYHELDKRVEALSVTLEIMSKRLTHIESLLIKIGVGTTAGFFALIVQKVMG